MPHQVIERGRAALAAPVRLFREIMHVQADDPPPALPDGAGTELAMGNIGLLTFVGSRYGVALLLMFGATNRIHHLVRRAEGPQAQPPAGLRVYLLPFSKFLASGAATKYIRIPGLIALFRAWFLLGLITLDVAGLWRKSWSELPVLGTLGRWGQGMEMKDVSWQVFMCICVGLLCSSLARNMGGGRREARPGEATPSFNLFGYSMLLHIYSSPLAHSRQATHFAQGRPDLDGLIHLWLTLTELTWLHSIELSDKWKRRRLIPTGVCGALGLLHFFTSMWISPSDWPKYMFVPYLTFNVQMQALCFLMIGTTVFFNAISQIFSFGGIAPSQLLPIAAPRPTITDDWNMSILAIAHACLNSSRFAAGMRNEVAIVQLKPAWVDLNSEGVLDMVATQGNIETRIPKGFGKEISVVRAQVGEERASMTAIVNGGNPAFSTAYRKAFLDLWKTAGLVAIGAVRAGWRKTPGSRSIERVIGYLYNTRWWYGPRSFTFWRRESWRRSPSAIKVPNWNLRMLEGGERLMRNDLSTEDHVVALHALQRTVDDFKAFRELSKKVPGNNFSQSYSLAEAKLPMIERLIEITKMRDAQRRVQYHSEDDDVEAEEIYQQFLAGTELEEDEVDEEWRPQFEREMSVQSEAFTDDGEEAGVDTDDDEEEGVMPIGLYADLATGDAGPSTPRASRNARSRSTTPVSSRLQDNALQPVLLAHLTSASSSPLTRRGYSRLLTQGSPGHARYAVASSSAVEQNYMAVTTERRARAVVPDRDEVEEERQRMCAVCTCSVRDVILWPCRCLAICGDCRENMADRLPAEQHICPCCRRPVEGFSRIYIP